MRCPWCGSPVIIRKNRWECGYCGDSGFLSSSQRQKSESEQPCEITLTFSLSLVQKIDFQVTWEKMKDILQTVTLHHCEELFPLLPSVFLYEISYAMSIPGHTTNAEKFHKLEAFLQNEPDFQDMPTIRDIIYASENSTVLYEIQGKLTEDFCGSFWRALIKQVTDEGMLDTVNDLLRKLAYLYSYFVSDEPDGHDYDRRTGLRDAFETHWYWNRYFHPDAIAAAVRLSSDDTRQIDDDCRDILVSAFPDYFRKYSLDEIIDVVWDYMLENLREEDPELAASMWKTLLDTAGSDFSMNPKVGEYLLSNNPFAEDDESW